MSDGDPAQPALSPAVPPAPGDDARPATPAACPVAGRLAAEPGALMRLLVAIAADELARLRGRAVPRPEWERWGPGTPVDEDGMGFDSLGRLGLVARLNRAFALHRSGVEDYLLVRPTLGEWAGILGAGLRLQAPRPPVSLAFQTSGSTGEPKWIEHRLADLAEEARAHGGLLPGRRRVVALVPPHHLYGFLLALLGPLLRGLPVLDLRGADPARVARELVPGDCIVATPFLWEILLRAGVRFPPDVTGTSSTAPAEPALWDGLAQAGLAGLLEIHGSTETAGIGHRACQEEPFTLFDGIERVGATGLSRGGGAPVEAADLLEWTAPRRFRHAGRRDGAVQVGGVNVHPARVASLLGEIAGVAACAVRLDAGGAGARLKAFVVPEPAMAGSAALETLEAELRAVAARRLPAPARPARYRFGAALPRSETGKPADWA